MSEETLESQTGAESPAALPAKARRGRKPKAAPVKRNRVKWEYIVLAEKYIPDGDGVQQPEVAFFKTNLGPFPDTKSAINAAIVAGYEGQFHVAIFTKSFATEKRTSVVLV